MKFSYFILFVVGLIAFFSCKKDYADEAYIVLQMEEYPSGEGMDSVFCVVVDQKVYYPKYGQFTTVDEIDEEDILFSGYSTDGLFSRKIDLNNYPEDHPAFQIVVDLDHEEWVGNLQTGTVSMYQNGYDKNRFYKELKYAKKANVTFQFQNVNCSGVNDSINLKYRILDFYDNKFFYIPDISYFGCNITDTLDRNFLQGNYEFKWEVYKNQDTLYGDTLITLGSLQQHFIIEM